MRRNHKTPRFIAMFIVTLCVIFSMVGKAVAFFEGEREPREPAVQSDDDPTCANAIPLNDLRQVQIVSRGNYDGCVHKSRLLCSLERAGLGDYDLDNIMRYTVARKNDGACVRVNLEGATIFRYGTDGADEFSTWQYLNPTRALPQGVLTFGAPPQKTILYVRAELDKCDLGQGGNLYKCEQERDALKAELAMLKSASSSATAALPGPSPQTTARPGEESGLARSATGPSPQTTTTSNSAAPEGTADIMTAALNQQGQEFTAIKNAIADCNSDSNKRVQINANGKPVCVTIAAAPGSVNLFLGILIGSILLLAILFVFKTKKAGEYHGHLEAIRAFFSLNTTLPYNEFADEIGQLVSGDKEKLRDLYLQPIANELRLSYQIKINTSTLITAIKQLREKAEAAWKALANIRRELAINSDSDPVQAIKDIKAHHTCEIEMIHADLDKALKEGDHSNCVPRDQHANCVNEFVHLSDLSVAREESREIARQRIQDLMSPLMPAQAGLQYLIDHPNVKPSGKKGQPIIQAVKTVLGVIQTLTEQSAPAPQAQA